MLCEGTEWETHKRGLLEELQRENEQRLIQLGQQVYRHTQDAKHWIWEASHHQRGRDEVQNDDIFRAAHPES